MRSSIEVRVRDCACPDKPHDDGDVVYLNEKLSASGGIAAEQEIAKSFADPEALTQRLLVAFVRHEATGWNLTDALGKPLPFDVEDLLADWTLSRNVITRAGELYTQVAIAPFQSKPGKPLPTGRTPATRSRTQQPTPAPSVS